MSDVKAQLLAVVDTEGPREQRANAAAETIRVARGFRWVGIYDVGDDEITLLGHTGASPPQHPHFPIDQGLSGEAVRTRATVISNDVRDDPRYLSAFEGTGSEIIVPVLGAESGIVIGTLEVESDRENAFSDEDVGFLEECASALRPLYD